MSPTETKHESVKINELQKQGFTASYIVEDNMLKDLTTEKKYDHKQVNIVEQYRYEGLSNPSDMSILYAIEMDDSSKGTILVAYGPTADSALSMFMLEVEKSKNS